LGTPALATPNPEPVAVTAEDVAVPVPMTHRQYVPVASDPVVCVTATPLFRSELVPAFSTRSPVVVLIRDAFAAKELNPDPVASV
jgi:hypothetical protein